MLAIPAAKRETTLGPVVKLASVNQLFSVQAESALMLLATLRSPSHRKQVNRMLFVLQLQETLLQREEELTRLQEENHKLRGFLSSSFVRKLEEKAKVHHHHHHHNEPEHLSEKVLAWLKARLMNLMTPNHEKSHQRS